METRTRSTVRGESDNEVRRVSARTEYLVFFGLALILITVGFLLAPSFSVLMNGFKTIILHPSLIDFDGFSWAGNLGTPFVNAGVMLLLVLLVYRLTGTDLQGTQIAAMMMATGFSFYGKNLLNVWFPLIGVFLYAAIRKKPLKTQSALAWFSTALSPVFSVTAFGTEGLNPGSPLAIGLGILLGIFSGVIVSVFSDYLPKIHKGRILFNAGFAAGIAGLFINAIQKAFFMGHERYPYTDSDYTSGENGKLFLMLAVIFLYFIIIGLALGGGKNYKRLLWYRCYGGNFIEEFGFGASLLNMGIMGFLACGFVFLTINGQFNGPVYAAIFTAAGFAAAGVTIREYLPCMSGVFLMSLLAGGATGLVNGDGFLSGALAKAGSRNMIMAAIYSCGLAPADGNFGWRAGLFLGAIHSILVTTTGVIHGWMSLYNNGLSLSILVVFLYPIYSRFKLGKGEQRIVPEDE